MPQCLDSSQPFIEITFQKLKVWGKKWGEGSREWGLQVVYKCNPQEAIDASLQ